MYKLVLPPGEDIIHVIPQDYIIDNEHGIRTPIGMQGDAWKQISISLPDNWLQQKISRNVLPRQGWRYQI
jgi:cell division ATPase FtsA